MTHTDRAAALNTLWVLHIHFMSFFLLQFDITCSLTGTPLLTSLNATYAWTSITRQSIQEYLPM